MSRTLRGIIVQPCDERDELLEILRTMVATGGKVMETADRLYVSRDTVASRVGRIADLTGLHLRTNFQERLLGLAVLYLEAHGDAVLGLDDPPGP